VAQVVSNAYEGRISFPEGPRIATIDVRYNDANNQVNRWHWNVPAGVSVRIELFDKDTGAPLFDETKVGPDAGDESVPGNDRMIEVTDEHGTYLDLPWNHRFSMFPTP
jgi:hypothetical protein